MVHGVTSTLSAAGPASGLPVREDREKVGGLKSHVAGGRKVGRLLQGRTFDLSLPGRCPGRRRAFARAAQGSLLAGGLFTALANPPLLVDLAQRLVLVHFLDLHDWRPGPGGWADGWGLAGAGGPLGSFLPQVGDRLGDSGTH